MNREIFNPFVLTNPLKIYFNIINIIFVRLKEFSVLQKNSEN